MLNVIINSSYFQNDIKKCITEIDSGYLFKISYPKDLNYQNWDTLVKTHYSENNKVNFDLIRTGNIYAVYEIKNNQTQLKYIGERKTGNLIDRLGEHFRSKGNDNGSILHEVKNSIINGNEIGVRAIEIQPDTLRLYFEEELILHYSQSTSLWKTKK